MATTFMATTTCQKLIQGVKFANGLEVVAKPDDSQAQTSAA